MGCLGNGKHRKQRGESDGNGARASRQRRGSSRDSSRG